MRKPELVATTLSDGLVRMCTTSAVVVWAAHCTERVLPYFERAYPEDRRLRQALETVFTRIRASLPSDRLKAKTEARRAALAAFAAARVARPNAPACSAALAAAHTAATYRNATTHAIYAAWYALTAIRDASDRGDADAAVRRERIWQHDHLLALTDDHPYR